MRERSQTTPRRRGPKLATPRDHTAYIDERFDVTVSESPYYTIDNTEDIYGTTLLPSQRCYVDPWDLENYDYVRKKLDSPQTPGNCYDKALTPSPVREPPLTSDYYEPPMVAPRMAATMPRNGKSRSHYHCELACCAPPSMAPRSRRYEELELRDGLYGLHATKCAGDFPMPDEEDVDQNIYIGYGGLSSSSSTERHSSIGEDSMSALVPRPPGYNPSRYQSHAGTLVKAQPKSDLPAPSAYDYCNPYTTLPCSVSDCYECMSQAQQSASLLYAAPSMYGSSSAYGGAGIGGDASYDNTLGRRPSSSLYSGIYSTKFGLSKKGLLQIDYSCSWSDLDRIIGRNY